LLIATVFLRMVFFCFFYDFLRNYLFLFYFLILSWLKITVTIYEESTVIFLANYCGLLQFFSHMVLFCFVMFFLKIIFVNFIFQILSWLIIVITSKYKFFLTKHYGLIQFFLTWFFSSFFCVFFFCNIFFPKLSSSILFFLILRWLEFNFCVFFLILSWL
jgi:hypothetical protein